MCGITGAISLDQEPLAVDRLKPMVDVVAHRGPDDAGYLIWRTGVRHPRGYSYGHDFTDCHFHGTCPWLPPIDSHSGQEMLHGESWDVFLGHRRLSIIDLSSRAHQPMCNKSRDLWLIYNGEIYNFQELREQLCAIGYEFVSNSDTELIIHAYHEWGVDCVHRFNGMFAFALYDNRKKRVWLARDRYGIKPLYYTLTEDGVFLFGSEIRSILQYLKKKPDVDLAALNEYFSFQNIFSDRTLFSGIRLLAPGHYLEIDLASTNNETARPPISNTQYWDFDFSQQIDAPAKSSNSSFTTCWCRPSNVNVSAMFPSALISAAAWIQGRSVRSPNPCGVVFRHLRVVSTSEAAKHEKNFDERELAEHMANLLQTEHYECVLHSGDMEAVMSELIWHLEDLRVGQCYPNYYLARLASKFVKVVMSGMGGDELFGGYPWRYAAAMGNGNGRFVENYYHYWQRLVPNHEKRVLFNADIGNRLQQMNVGGAVPFQNHTYTVFRDVYPREIVTKTRDDQVNNALYFECKTFLPGLFIVEDKLSMAHSLETRVPLLDNDLVDFACRIPVRHKISNLDKLVDINENVPTAIKKRASIGTSNNGKNILRNTMERIIPSEITRADKQGFSAPDESWFRGRSEQYVRDLLLNRQARIYEYLNPEYVKRVLDIHRAGDDNKRLLIWSLLSFEHWLKVFQPAAH